MKLCKFHLKFLMQFRRVCDKLSNLTKLRLGAFFCRQSWSLADVSWPSFNQLVSLSIRQLVIRSVFVIQWVGSVRQCDNYLRNELNNLYFPLEWLLQVFFPRSLRFCFLHFNCSLAAKSGDGGGKWGGGNLEAQLVACYEKFIYNIVYLNLEHSALRDVSLCFWLAGLCFSLIRFFAPQQFLNVISN